MPAKALVGNALTDGTGVSSITGSKVVKDFVADCLLTGASALVAVNIMSVGDAVQSPQVAVFAVIGAVIRALYRTVLRWATSP